jgi:hypothetical protein
VQAAFINVVHYGLWGLRADVDELCPRAERRSEARAMMIRMPMWPYSYTPSPLWVPRWADYSTGRGSGKAKWGGKAAKISPAAPARYGDRTGPSARLPAKRSGKPVSAVRTTAPSCAADCHGRRHASYALVGGGRSQPLVMLRACSSGSAPETLPRNPADPVGADIPNDIPPTGRT